MQQLLWSAFSVFLYFLSYLWSCFYPTASMFTNKKFPSACIWTFLLRIKFPSQSSAIIMYPNKKNQNLMLFGLIRDEKNCLVTVSLFACVSPIIIYWYAHQCLNAGTGRITLGKWQGVLNTVLNLDMWPNTVILKFNSLLLHTVKHTEPWHFQTICRCLGLITDLVR